MTTTTKTAFNLGRVVVTPGILAAVPKLDIVQALRRHGSCDWGDLDERDLAENQFSLEHGFRLLSAYRSTDGTRFWVITEADRSATTVLLPDEY